MEMTPSPDSTAPEAEAKLQGCPLCGADVKFEHSYHEDNHRYPRDFWHVRITCCYIQTDWMQYGEQEKERFDPVVRKAAEAKLAAIWNTRATRQESGEDSKQAVQIIEQLDALWASWLQSVSPKAREEIEAAVATIRKLILDSAMSRKEGAQL